MIQIQNLVKRFGSKYAVDDISFGIDEGEIVGFLGPNGAGKSTTMNIITGYMSSTSGTVSIGGIDILENPTEAKRFIGYLPEQPPLYLDMTVREYLNFVYELKGCKLNRKKHLAEICEVVKIADDFNKNRLIKNLSKGYKQRVGIAQALVGNPRVIILDEPTVGLDPKEIIEIRNLIRTLGETHTVILSTHILPEVQAVCDRILIINAGKIVADEKTENISKMIEGTPPAERAHLRLAARGAARAAQYKRNNDRRGVRRARGRQLRIFDRVDRRSRHPQAAVLRIGKEQYAAYRTRAAGNEPRGHLYLARGQAERHA